MTLDATSRQHTVHLYVYDGFADWEPAYAIAGLHSPRFQREPGHWAVRTVGERAGAPVRSMGGLAILPEMALETLEPAASAMLLLPGGPGWDLPSRQDVPEPHHAAVARARAFVEAGVPLAAICGATAGLARAGLLDRRPHTSNAASYLHGTGYAGADHYRDEPAVRDGLLITAGGMAPLEFAREIFALLGLYEPEALEAWYQLYKTGRSEHFARLQRATQAGAGD
jgi:putative intracellular protease/amidase